jgi:hypothetical protein
MRLSLLAALVGVGLVYIGAVFLIPTGAYWTPDNGLKQIQAAHLRFTPWPDLALGYAGQDLDPDHRFVPCALPVCYEWQGRTHIAQPSIAAFLALPFLPFLGERGGVVMPLAAGLLSAALVGLWMQRARLEPGWLGVLLAGLATPLFFYSLLWWEHTLAVALGLSALLVGSRSARRRDDALAGALAGLAGSVRKEMLLFAVVLGIQLMWRVFRRERPLSAFALWLCAGALALLPWWWVSYLNSGDVVPPEFRISFAPTFSAQAYLVTRGPGGLLDFLIDPRLPGLSVGLGGLGLVYLAAGWVRAAGWRALVRTLVMVAFGLGSLLLLTERFPASGLVGVLNVSPMLLLAWHAPAEDRRALSDGLWPMLGYALLVSLNLGLASSAGPLQSGLEWGARFLLIIFPLSVPFVVVGLKALRAEAGLSRWGRWQWRAAWALVALSVFIQAVGLAEVRATVLERRESRDALLALPERAVVSGQFWFGPLTPDVYLDKMLFYVAASNIEGLAAWAQAARANGVRAWAYISHAPLQPAQVELMESAGAPVNIIEVIRLRNGRVITRLTFAAP